MTTKQEIDFVNWPVVRPIVREIDVTVAFSFSGIFTAAAVGLVILSFF